MQHQKRNEANDDSDSDVNEVDLNNKSIKFEEYSSYDVSNIIKHFLSLVRSKAIVVDRMFGVYLTAMGELEIGGSKIEFDEDVMIDKTNNVKYQFSKGLAELVFKKEPDVDLATDSDFSQYLQILLSINPHRKGNKSTGELKQTNEANRKYNDVIKPLLVLQKKITKSPYSGSGLPKYKIAKPSSTIDLVYWDDPNELVDRLRLLVAEQQAGNEIHTNEILSITEELREAGHIL